MRISSLLAATMLVISAALVAPVHAGQGTSATLSVHAVVARHAQLRFAQPASISVTESDIARGFVEVEQPVDMVVRSNDRSGYTVAFHCHCVSVREAQVEGLGQLLKVGGAGASANRPAANDGMWQDHVQLRFRFVLGPDASAGQYDWPLQVSLIPG
jgi:hypothetical protein